MFLFKTTGSKHFISSKNLRHITRFIKSKQICLKGPMKASHLASQTTTDNKTIIFNFFYLFLAFNYFLQQTFGLMACISRKPKLIIYFESKIFVILFFFVFNTKQIQYTVTYYCSCY